MREMKDSGIEWIGEIPKEWKVCKLKNITQDFYSGGTPTTSRGEFYTESKENPFVNISDLSNNNYLFQTGKYLTDLGIDDKNLKLVPANSILYGLYASIGLISENVMPVYISQAILSFKAQKNYSQLFLKYWLENLKRNLQIYYKGTTQNNLNSEIVRSFPALIPPVYDQQKIASYLDDKCSKIDTIIEKEQVIIEKLREYKQSLITEAVTKGLDTDVERKDSGSEYLGLIPQNWKLYKIRFLGKLQNGISKGGESFGLGYPFVSYGDVYKNFQLPESVEGLVESTESEQNNYSVELGDVFFTRTSETIEEVGLSSVCLKTLPKATFAGFLIRFRPHLNILKPTFSKYYFRSTHHRFYMAKEMNLVTRASLGQELLKNMLVLIPDMKEQEMIADYLENKCSEIDKAILNKESLIEKLTEYKKSLIYEVVTGKKEV